MGYMTWHGGYWLHDNTWYKLRMIEKYMKITSRPSLVLKLKKCWTPILSENSIVGFITRVINWGWCNQNSMAFWLAAYWNCSIAFLSYLSVGFFFRSLGLKKAVLESQVFVRSRFDHIICKKWLLLADEQEIHLNITTVSLILDTDLALFAVFQWFALPGRPLLAKNTILPSSVVIFWAL